MNPNCLASTFSVQQVSKHHYLIRGDERIKDYMNFCDVKWSNTYQGWIVHEDDEVELIQMHMEVMDLAKEERTRADKKKKKTMKKAKKSSKKSEKKPAKPTKTSKKKLIVTSDEDSEEEIEDEKPKKKKSGKKGDVYERFKRGEDISDDEDDEYVPSSEPSTETITEESDLDEEDTEEEEEDTEEEEEEDTEEESEEEEECETDPKRKKEFQFYKKGILAFGKMTDRQQEKLEAIWNKTLRGWIVRMSNLEKLKKQGWTEIGHEEEPQDHKQQQKQQPKLKEKVIDESTVVNTPKVTKKPKVEEEKTLEKHLFSLLVKGSLTLDQLAELKGIYHPVLKGYLVSLENRDKLLEMGFRDKTPVVETKDSTEKQVVRIDFTSGEELKQ